MVIKTYQLTTFQEEILKEKRQLVEDEGAYWNEEELKIRLIAILFEFAAIDVADKVKVFYERSLRGTVDKLALSVKCDCMIASPLGINTPKQPYFFLQEFKKGKGDKYDPEAQMMAAMLIAQHLNEDKDQPIYGGFVVGQFWNFTTLVGKRYCVSSTLDATKWSEILQIVYVLRHLRELILSR